MTTNVRGEGAENLSTNYTRLDKSNCSNVAELNFRTYLNTDIVYFIIILTISVTVFYNYV